MNIVVLVVLNIRSFKSDIDIGLRDTETLIIFYHFNRIIVKLFFLSYIIAMYLLTQTTLDRNIIQ